MRVEKRQKPCWSPEDLLHHARAGETEAFDQLFTRCKDGVYACLWHLLNGDADLVEEAVGSVFLNAYRNLDKFRGDAALSTWLYRIAVNEAHARLRQQRRRRLFAPLSFHEPAASDEARPKAEDPAERVIRTEE